MTRYAVGDVQGCLKPLQCLLAEVNFDPLTDELWLVGDLINRGPESLQTLRFIKQLGPCTRIVLGNHDLHFLAVAFGAVAARKADTLDALLAAPDRDELVNWLLQQPLLYTDPRGDYTMVHAGIPPNWTLAQASRYAGEVSAVLRSSKASEYFHNMYGNQPNRWDENLQGWERLRLVTNYLTRMRFCTADGELEFKHKLTRIEREDMQHFAPWHSYPQRLTRANTIIFGHWAALEGKAATEKVYALDTGCVWGRHLTLMNLETQQFHQCDCADQAPPKRDH